MPKRILSAFFVSGLVVLIAGAEETKPLPPVAARKKVGEKITVEMTVQAAKDRLEIRGRGRS